MVPLSPVTDVHNIPTHLELTSQTDPHAFSSMNYALNNIPEHLGMTSQTDLNAFSYMDYDLNRTPKENEEILKRTRR